MADILSKGMVPAGPAQKLVAITPNNDTVLNPCPRGLYVGTTGDVTVVALNDTAPVTFKDVPAGSTLDVAVQKVMATGTDAADIVGLI